MQIDSFWWTTSPIIRQQAISFPALVGYASCGALEGRGKRGGARVIYFFHDRGMPLFLLTAYAKNERTDLSQKDKNALKLLTTLLVEAFKGGER